ncbi:hypothetical protein, partial [Nostoc sp.]|uniref:hypothetical protein n=1 Tax=Nostoc sp. TaxID=1180 RepID=UPI002FF87903
KHKDKVAGWRNLSRFFDIKQLIDHSVDYKRNIMYVDSDVFFFRDPFPLMCYTKKMCISPWNAGILYFDRFYNQKFWEIYETYTMAAVYSEDIRQVFKEYIFYDSWLEVWNEMILDYMTVKHPQLFNFLPDEEHAKIQTFIRYYTRANLDKFKMFHANSLMVANPLGKVEGERESCRGLLCLVIEEFYNNIRQVLSDEDLQKIYTEKEINYYLPQSFSLFKNIDRLLATRDDNNYCHLLKMIQKC